MTSRNIEQNLEQNQKLGLLTFFPAELVVFGLKGQCHETFDPRFFHQGPESRAEAVFHMVSYSPRKSIRKSPKFDPAVSLTPSDQTFLSEFPFNIYVF
jgi:hypothetical protein